MVSIVAHDSKRNTILTTSLAMAERDGGSVTADDVSKAMNIQTRLEHRRLLYVLSELTIAGSLIRIDRGVYAPPSISSVPDKREVMWRVLHMRRRVDVETLMEMADVSKVYAREFLLWLTKSSYLRKEQPLGKKGVWVVIKDQVKCPVDTDKAKRLRNLRQKKNKALQVAIGMGSKGLTQAKEAIKMAEEAAV